MSTNRLLEALPAKDLNEVLASSEAVLLPVRSLLYESDIRPKYAYFITDGIASIVMNTARGQVAEVGIIGREGFTGAVHLLGSHSVPTECFMQIAGSARRIPMHQLENFFQHSASMHTHVLEFNQTILINSRQLAACNALHSIEQRLARWLLIVQDRMQSEGYALTHEFLAEMLVVQRPTLSIVAAALQREGIIHYRHGQLQILQRDRLEQTACECYAVARNLLQTMYLRPEEMPANDPLSGSPEEHSAS